MKRFGLTLFFATYYFFMPFVMSNCSTVDTPFSLESANASRNDTTSSNDSLLEECQQMEFLVDSCIDVLQAESDRIAAEQAQVDTALASQSDFEFCQSEEVIDGISTVVKFQVAEEDSTETDAEVEINCESVIQTAVQAFQTCDALSVFNKYEGCSDLEEIIEDTVELCDNADETVTEDFCNSLTA